jgi:hypothetical protein
MNLTKFLAEKRIIITYGKNHDCVGETFNSGPFYESEIGALRVANKAVKSGGENIAHVLEIDMMGNEPKIIHVAKKGVINKTTPNYGVE